jgi:FlaA1/EpsC-like NDP-sugar epimerase
MQPRLGASGRQLPVPVIGRVEPGDDERRIMNSIASGTVLITGPTGALGRAATQAIANRPAA